MTRTKDLRLTRDRRRTAKYGRGKRWLAQWDGPDGTEHSKAFATQVDAKRYGSAMEARWKRISFAECVRRPATRGPARP